MDRNKINICYWDNNDNWGDKLNRNLCYNISNKKINKVSPNITNNTFRYYAIGSRLESPLCGNYEVWGGGFMYENSSIKYYPNKVHAVRGKLSRDIYLKNDIDCPEIYGDPALLYPLFYSPKNITKKYKIGIIPHYIDKKLNWINNIQDEETTIIDIQSDTHNFIDKIHECEVIFSSTLHGMIAADSYDIPCYWTKFSDNVAGDGFKFYDYFSSVGREDTELYINNYNDIKKFNKEIIDYNFTFNKKPFFDACPFKKYTYDELIDMMNL